MEQVKTDVPVGEMELPVTVVGTVMQALAAQAVDRGDVTADQMRGYLESDKFVGEDALWDVLGPIIDQLEDGASKMRGDGAPTTLAEWYEDLVEVAGAGNAPMFEQEVDRVRALVLDDLHAQASDEEDKILDVLASCAWGTPIPARANSADSTEGREEGPEGDEMTRRRASGFVSDETWSQ